MGFFTTRLFSPELIKNQRVYLLTIRLWIDIINNADYGPVAQLGERCVRNAEVESSILFGSTTSPQAAYRLRRLFCKSHRRAHFAASPFPKKVTLRLCCSLVNALATLRIATNLFRGCEDSTPTAENAKYIFYVDFTQQANLNLVPVGDGFGFVFYLSICVECETFLM